LSVFQLLYPVVEFRRLTVDGGNVELSLGLREPGSRPVWPKWRKAHIAL
jgi:hypothetical protein